MDFNEYQKEAAKTIPASLTPEEIRENAIYGLMGEVGELVDIFKKIKFQGHGWGTETEKHILLEMGDIAWYLSELATGMFVDFDKIPTMNINKLRARYGERFDSNKSQNREEGDI